MAADVSRKILPSEIKQPPWTENTRKDKMAWHKNLRNQEPIGKTLNSVRL